MIESQIFRQSGVGSRAWYIHRIKIGYPAGKTGFTYLRADSGDDGKQLSFDEIKSSMSQLVAAGYVKKHGKPDAPRSDKYEVTSFGHRYLEEHKSELEQKPEPKSTGAVQAGVSHTVPRAPEFRPSIPQGVQEGVSVGVATAESSPVPEQRPEAQSGPETPAPEKNSPPAPAPEPIQESPKSEILDRSFSDQLRSLAGELALEKFADQITVRDLLDHVEADNA